MSHPETAQERKQHWAVPFAERGQPAGRNASPPHEGATGFWEIDEEAILCPPASLRYEIALDTFFNARHYVTIAGNAGNLHTHSYRLHVRYRTNALVPEDHVVVGYQVLRERTEGVVKAYNNRLLNDLPPFQRLQPTTENLTAVLFQQLQRALADLPVEIVNVTVWESPTAAITYGPF